MNKDSILNELKWSIQSLALDGRGQIDCFPEFVVVTDELLLEFENWYGAAVGNCSDHFNVEQRTALDQLYSKLDSYESTSEFPSDLEELEKYEFWTHIRAIAKEVLGAMNWEQGFPPKERGGSYIQTRWTAYNIIYDRMRLTADLESLCK